MYIYFRIGSATLKSHIQSSILHTNLKGYITHTIIPTLASAGGQDVVALVKGIMHALICMQL